MSQKKNKMPQSSRQQKFSNNRSAALAQYPIKVAPDVRQGIIKPIRAAASQQSKTIDIVVVPSSLGMSKVCAHVVLYALSVGFSKDDAFNAWMALQVLMIDAMKNGPVRLEKAPAFWWYLTNAVRPKTIVGRFVNGKRGRRTQITPTVSYDWDTTKISVNSNPIIDGYCFGPVLTSSTNGFWTIDTSLGTPPSVIEAADIAANMFGKLGNDHPLQNVMSAYLLDPSAFCFKLPWYSTMNPNDDGLTAFSIIALEVPIRSPWLGFLNLVEIKATGVESRIPKYQRSGQGGAQHLGVRLDFPRFLAQRYNDLSLDFRPVPIGQEIKRATAAWQQANNILADGGRSTMPPDSTGTFVPPYFYGGNPGVPPISDTNNPGVNKGTWLVHQMIVNCALFLSRPASWAGVNQTFAAITAGTNNIDPTITEGVLAELFTIANQRELGVNYIRPLNKLVICFPTINEDFASEWAIEFPRCFDTGTVPDYGGTTADFLNSNIGSTTIAWTEGKSLPEDLKNVSRIFTIYSGLVPTAPSDAIISPPNTNLPVESEFVVQSQSKSAELFAIIARQRRLGKGAVNQLSDLFETSLRRRADKAAGKFADVKVSTLTSPSMVPMIALGTGSSFEVEATRGIEDNLISPVAYYDNFTTRAPKIISDLVSTFEPAFNTATSYDNKTVDTGFNLAKDFTNDQQSQILTDLQTLTSNEVTNTQANWEDIIETVTDFLPPRFRVIGSVAKALVPIGKKIAQNVRTRRAQKAKK